DEVDDTVAAAVAAAEELAAAAPGERAGWLQAVADALQDQKAALAEAADEEVALGLPRLTGECGRAADTIRFYASVVREGGWLRGPAGARPPRRAPGAR